MTQEEWHSVEIIVGAIFGSRIWSMLEHRNTGKKVNKTETEMAQIKIYFNGELEKKLDEARQAGILMGIEMQKKAHNGEDV